jgi:4-azaleucine resistance transporter AzlC
MGEMRMRDGEPRRGSARRSEFAAGAVLVAPLVVSVLPFGLLLGTLAAQRGLSPLETFLMSASVFAGSAQFAVLGQWSTPVAIAALGATALLVNLRHVLMAAALAPALGAWPRPGAYGAMFFLADEVWALALRRAARDRLTPAFYLGLALPMWTAWVASTTLGNGVGAAIEDPARYGLDFAFTAVFLVLLVGLWRGPRSLAPWVASALAAVAVERWLPGAWYILAGALAGCATAALAGAGADDADAR